MPLKFWDDAFLTATFLINRFPTHVLNYASLIATLFGADPSYSFLCTFGCACWLHLHPYQTHKLSFRSTQCVFLDYSTHHKGLDEASALSLVGEATSLIINLGKTDIIPIRCHSRNIEEMIGSELQINQFPCMNLGSPLHYKRLPKYMIQPMVQNIGNKLLGWNVSELNYQPGMHLLMHFTIIYLLLFELK
jgi:hypothetical protein